MSFLPSASLPAPARRIALSSGSPSLPFLQSIERCVGFHRFFSPHLATFYSITKSGIHGQKR
jgi:hypothetical protein